MAEILSVESLKQAKEKAMASMKVKLSIATAFNKNGEEHLAKEYLREAFMFNQKANRMDARIKLIESAIS